MPRRRFSRRLLRRKGLGNAFHPVPPDDIKKISLTRRCSVQNIIYIYIHTYRKYRYSRRRFCNAFHTYRRFVSTPKVAKVVRRSLGNLNARVRTSHVVRCFDFRAPRRQSEIDDDIETKSHRDDARRSSPRRGERNRVREKKAARQSRKIVVRYKNTSPGYRVRAKIRPGIDSVDGFCGTAATRLNMISRRFTVYAR